MEAVGGSLGCQGMGIILMGHKILNIGLCVQFVLEKERERMIWFSSDLHMGHANILSYADRPFSSLKEMNETLVNNWNTCIAKEDTVYFLGDLCFPKYIRPEAVLESLNGNITLIKGNHDKRQVLKLFKGRWYNQIDFPIVTEKRTYKCILNHRPVWPKGTPDPYNDHDSSIDPDKYDFIIHGHTHKRRVVNGKNINIGIDAHDYFPVPLNKLIDLISGNGII